MVLSAQDREYLTRTRELVATLHKSLGREDEWLAWEAENAGELSLPARGLTAGEMSGGLQETI